MLTLPAKLTHDDAGALVRSLKSQIALQPGAIEVAAGQLSEFDSSALAVLLECRRAATGAGKRFAVIQMPSKLVQLANLYGVEPLLVPDNSAVPA